MSVLKKIEKYKRTAWQPVVVDGDGLPTDSKFAGVPFLLKEEDTPLCSNCKNPLQLFVQLDLNNLPVGNKFGRGLLQLFYCTNEEPLCEVECEAFFPFAESTLIRIIKPGDLKRQYQNTFYSGNFPPKKIIGWKGIVDYPNREEGESLGIELSDEEWEELYEENYPIVGEKLDGFPMWIQGVEYPTCPVCDERMRLVFQIDSEGNLPYMFGDVGCAHLTQCETHKEQLAFGWACS